MLGLLVLIAHLISVAGPMSGSATFYCSDGRDGSPVSECTRGQTPDSHTAAIDRRDTPWDVGDRVTVHGPSGSVTVRIVTGCACKGNRLIDLPIGMFERVAGDWRPGTVPVTITAAGVRPDQALPPLPPTDTE